MKHAYIHRQGGMADIEFDGEKKIKADFIFRVYALLSAQLVLTVAIAAGVASNDSMKSVAIFLFGNTVGSPSRSTSALSEDCAARRISHTFKNV